MLCYIDPESVTMIERSAPTRGSDGRIGPATETRTENVTAALDPVPGDVLAALPEGERNTKQYLIITEYELTEGDEDANTFPTRVEYEGELYEVRGPVQKYRRLMPHNDARIVRVSPNV